MPIKYVCPFCDVQLPKEEMQFHVGIPLCMKARKDLAASEEIPGAFAPIPVSGLKYRYFGRKGIQELLMASLKHGYGDPPLKLEEFIDHSED